MARAFGVEVEEIAPDEVKNRYDHLNIKGVTGGVYLPLDGQGDPANIALALAKGARQCGAHVYERVAVTKILRDGRRVTGVDWTRRGWHAWPDHLRSCCELCWHVGPRGGAHGRCQRAAASLRAFLHRDRAYRGADPVAGPAGSGRMRLLQGRCGENNVSARLSRLPSPGRLTASRVISNSISCPRILTISSQSSRRP